MLLERELTTDNTNYDHPCAIEHAEVWQIHGCITGTPGISGSSCKTNR